MDAKQVYKMVEEMAQVMTRQDNEAIVEFYTEDAIFISPAGRFIGRQAIHDVIALFNRDYTNIVISIKDVIVCADKGAIEWSFAETRKSDGYTHVMEDAVVFQLRDGKVAYWREYFDPHQKDLL
jgi:uncharacterized protein (TIGR02246 family)